MIRQAKPTGSVENDPKRNSHRRPEKAAAVFSGVTAAVFRQGADAKIYSDICF